MRRQAAAPRVPTDPSGAHGAERGQLERPARDTLCDPGKRSGSPGPQFPQPALPEGALLWSQPQLCDVACDTSLQMEKSGWPGEVR